MIRNARLPRHKRITDPPPMQLTARDRDVVKAVWSYRFLRQDQIQALLFPSKWTAQYRLVRLYQHWYLDRIFTAVPFGRGRTVYCVGKRGAELLSLECDADPKPLPWKPDHNRVSHPFLEHTLAVNDVRIALTLACNRVDCSLERWTDEQVLRKEHSRDEERVDVESGRGKRRRLAVIADGYFILQHRDRRGHFFLEVDRATISNTRWMQKIRAYQAYYQTGKYQAKYGTKSLRVLTVTTGEKRLAYLKTCTERVGGGLMFWLTTFAEASPGGILTKPIWRVAGQGGKHTLVANSPRKKLDLASKVWYTRSV